MEYYHIIAALPNKILTTLEENNLRRLTGMRKSIQVKNKEKK